MTHHRCTRCKRESYPRHKHLGGVFCDDCINMIRNIRHRKHSWLGSLWGRFVEKIRQVFRPASVKQDLKTEERKTYVLLKSLESKARKIQSNPQHILPQKH